MKPLLIYGAAGHAKTVIDAAECAGREVAEVVCDNPYVTTLYGIPVRSPDASLYLGRDYQFIVAIGSNADRQRVFEWLLKNGGEPATIIHPAADASRFSTVGAGSVVLAQAHVDPSVEIGCNCIINAGALVGHDSVVGDHTHVSGLAIVGAKCRVGQRVFVGLHATINGGVTVGDDATVAMGALVNRDVPSGFKALTAEAARVMRLVAA
jgi:acetyltransferase EpsM